MALPCWAALVQEKQQHSDTSPSAYRRGTPLRGRTRLPLYLAVRDMEKDAETIVDAARHFFLLLQVDGA